MCAKSLVINCPTSWNSTYDMLSSALKFKYDNVLDTMIKLRLIEMCFLEIYYKETATMNIKLSTFSTGGRVIDPYRSSLAPNTVQALICGGNWVRDLHDVKKNQKVEILLT
ncbi:uncharacterized protein [Aristolochia californica]|uniref:uncharacterized protein n=1 Tax=Aristolochia californica TaxID=171875 RepID=UPI0035DBEA79